MRHARDLATLTAGLTCIVSQILIQWQSRGTIEPNVAIITAGVGLLTSWPLLKLGDRRADHEGGDGGSDR